MYKYLLPTAAILLGFVILAYAQVYTGQANPVAAVCAYNSSVPSPTSGQFFYIQCDSSGRLRTK